MTFGERLKELRKRKYSQEELAEVLHVHNNTISRWENGEQEPRAKKVIELANLLGTTSAYLLGDTDDPSPTINAVSRSAEDDLNHINKGTKSENKFNFSDTSFIERLIKGNQMVIYESDNERIYIPATNDGFKFLMNLKTIEQSKNTTAIAVNS